MALSVTRAADLSARLPFQLKLFPARLDSTTKKKPQIQWDGDNHEAWRDTLEQYRNVCAIAMAYRMPHGATH